MSLTKRLDEARESYKKKDLERSAAAHTEQAILHGTERHGGSGDQYIGSVVYGGLDGVVTTFAAVSGVAGAALGANVILIMGFANLLADGFSMAVGAYLSDKSEKEYYEREFERESWEVEHFPDGEKLELVALYKEQGYSDEDARQLVQVVSKKKKTWLNTMMLEELGLMKSDKDPIRSALLTFGAFVAAGLVPMLIFLLGLVVPIQGNSAFLISAGLSALTLFGLGAAKVKVTGMNAWRSGLEMLLVGGLAAIVAYLVGLLLKSLGL